MSFQAAVEGILQEDYCVVAATTLLGYEYFLHLPQEVRLIWKSRLTGVSVLFLSNRYLSLLSQALNFASPTSEKSCSATMYVSWTIGLLPLFPMAAFSSLRAYALCEDHLRLPVAVLVFLLSMVPIAVNFAKYRWFDVVIDPTFGCANFATAPEELQKSFTIASRTCLIAADLVVLCVTWHATYRTVRLGAIAEMESKPTFAKTLLRDGAIYFITLAFLNCLHLLFTMLSISSNSSLQDTSDVTLFTDPVTSILLSRFILNLQEVEHYRVNPHLSSLSSGQGSIMFDRVIGSLGSSLPPGDTSLAEVQWQTGPSDDQDDSDDKAGQEDGAD